LDKTAVVQPARGAGRTVERRKGRAGAERRAVYIAAANGAGTRDDAEPGLEYNGAGGGAGMRETRDASDQTDFGGHVPGGAADLDGTDGSDGVGELEGPSGGQDIGPETWQTREGPDPDQKLR
jgi:hypothetical protein